MAHEEIGIWYVSRCSPEHLLLILNIGGYHPSIISSTDTPISAPSDKLQKIPEPMLGCIYLEPLSSIQNDIV